MVNYAIDMFNEAHTPPHNPFLSQARQPDLSFLPFFPGSQYVCALPCGAHLQSHASRSIKLKLRFTCPGLHGFTLVHFLSFREEEGLQKTPFEALATNLETVSLSSSFDFVPNFGRRLFFTSHMISNTHFYTGHAKVQRGIHCVIQKKIGSLE